MAHRGRSAHPPVVAERSRLGTAATVGDAVSIWGAVCFGVGIRDVEKIRNICRAGVVGLPKPVRHYVSIYISLTCIKFYSSGCNFNVRGAISWRCVLFVSLAPEVPLEQLLGTSNYGGLFVHYFNIYPGVAQVGWEILWPCEPTLFRWTQGPRWPQS